MGGGKGGSSGSQTVTQKADPWSGIQPQLLQAASGAQNLYNSGGLNFTAYPGQTVAPQSSQTQLANQLTTQRAINGSPVTGAAQQQVTSTLNGDYLDPTKNPGFQQALTDTQKAYSTGTAAQTDAAFNRSGAYGGSAYDETKQMQNKAYGDSLNTLAGNMYQQGRNNQLQAAALAPQTANTDYTNLAALSGVGSAQDQYGQQQINSNIDHFNTNQAAPANALQNYVNLINGTGGAYKGQTTTQPTYSNGAANALGLLGGVGSIANMGVNTYNALPTAAAKAAKAA